MKYILSLFILLFFIACDDTTSTNISTNSNTKIAYLYDTAINGVQYKCGSITGLTGDTKTKELGSFYYQDDCKVKFTIGKIYLGSVSSKNIKEYSKVYPTNLVGINTTDSNNTKIINILRFLQTLDDDNNTLNGITISEDVRNNLNLSTTNTLDLTRTDLNDSILQEAINDANISRILITRIKAIAHFEETLRKYKNIDIDTVPPAKPYITNPENNISLKENEFIINGEIGSKIFIAFNSDGNQSNLNFIDYNKIINSTRKEKITLDLNNTNISHFHYFIKLKDNKNRYSDYLHLNILKDNIPPSANQNTITKEVTEEQKLVLDVNVTDISDITYSILNTNDSNNTSVDYLLFNIDRASGFVTFKVEPNYEEDKRNYIIVVRAEDEANNTTDVLLNINLTNLLDNPPSLTSTSYSTNLFETNINGTHVYDLNTTLNNLIIAPDNIFPVIYKLHNHTDIFDINLNTGELIVKNSSDDFFDFEKNVPHIMDLNISIENNNTSDSGNKVYLSLNINILNKIDTTPKLNTPNDINISEHRNSPIYTFFTVDINETLSDKDTSMNFTILSGNDGNFTINNNGDIMTTGDTLDFETKKKYNLTIRATNTFWNNDTNLNYDDINIVININNVIDNAPSIEFTSQTNSIVESTDENITVATIDTNGSIYDQNIVNIYTITTNNTPFKINPNTGTISTSRQLLNDYNETNSNNSITNFKVEIIAKNTYWNNVLHKSNKLVLDINITNAIDNKPILKQPTTQIIDENTSIWSYQIQPNGINFDTNQTTYFSIINGANNKFKISNTGLVELNSSLDWEAKKSYTISIDASNTWWDNSINKSEPIYLNININNIIEKSPKINAPIVINIHENTDGSTIIARLDINSTEVDEQNIDNFEIVSGNDGNFTIDYNPILDQNTNKYYGELKLTGQLNNRGNLNWDINKSYDINITATNSFGTSDPKTIHVNIINDVDIYLPLLVIAVQYDDINISTNDGIISDLFFGENFKQLNDYFYRVSKHKFKFSIADENNTNLNDGVIRINMGKNHPLDDSFALKSDLKNALIATDSYIDYSIYDKNNDGNLSKDELQILFIIAGGEITYGDTNQSIKAFSSSFDDNITLDNKNIAYTAGNGKYVVIGEKNGENFTTIGLAAYHLAHSALNFPYLGDTTNASYGIGYFGLMGYGYRGSDKNESIGTTPVNPSAYNILSQGWVTPTIISKNTTNIELISSNKGTAGFNIIKIPTDDIKKYYLIENRVLTDTTGYDIGFYGMENKPFNGGLAVWYINTLNTNNNDVNKKLVDIVEYDKDTGLDSSKIHFGKSTSLYHENDPTYQNIDTFKISNSSLENNETNTMIIDIDGF